MESMEDPNYKTGIKKIMTGMRKVNKIEKHGLDFMNRLLQNLNLKMVNKITDIGLENATVEEVRKIVDEHLKGSVKNLALAEAGRLLTLHSDGLFGYRPHKVSVKRKKKKRKSRQAIVIAAEEFSTGVGDLSSLICPVATLTDQSHKIMNELLKEIAEKISDIVQEKAEDSITPNNIREAVLSLFPRTLASHALAEGARMLIVYEKGRLEQSDKRRRKYQ